MWKENERNIQSRDTNNVDTSNVNTVDDFDDLDTEQENVPIEGAQGQEVRSQCVQTCTPTQRLIFQAFSRETRHVDFFRETKTGSYPLCNRPLYF